MTKYHRLLCVLIATFLYLNPVFAQDSSEKIRATTNHMNLGLSSVSILDNYISDLNYNGAAFRFSNISRKRLDTEKGVWVYLSDQVLDLGTASNSAQTAGMFFSNFQCGWGVQKGLKISDDFRVFVGGTVDFQFISHQSDRDVNNSFNMNLASNLNAALTLIYDATIWNKDVQFLFDARVPVVGMTFLPDQGISYYEMYMNNDLSSHVHVTSLHNKQMFQRQAWVQIPLKRVFLNVGMQLESNFIQLGRNNFKTESFTLMAGMSYHFSIFGGKKNKSSSIITEAENW